MQAVPVGLDPRAQPLPLLVVALGLFAKMDRGMHLPWPGKPVSRACSVSCFDSLTGFRHSSPPHQLRFSALVAPYFERGGAGDA